MDLATALAQTDANKGPRSYLEQFIEDIANRPESTAVLTELTGTRQAAHLARALTILAREVGTLGSDQSITGQSVSKWRAANGS